MLFWVQMNLYVIITSNLNQDQEEKLLNLLKKNKKALGWTLWDIKGICFTIVQHMIYLEDGARPHRDRQRRLNPILPEVVRKEVLKWLDHGIIYPISDSEYVSPVKVVLKKTGITMIRRMTRTN